MFCYINLSFCSSMIKSRPKYDSKNQPKWLTHPKNSSEKPDIVIDYKEYVYLHNVLFFNNITL